MGPSQKNGSRQSTFQRAILQSIRGSKLSEKQELCQIVVIAGVMFAEDYFLVPDTLQKRLYLALGIGFGLCGVFGIVHQILRWRSLVNRDRDIASETDR